MITLKELNPKGHLLTEEQEVNLPILHRRINIIREKRALSMVVTSGVRSVEDHKRIYTEKARKAGMTAFRVPMGSMHLKGAAVDIYDPGGELYRWCKENEGVLVEAALWCEEGTNGWVHFQIYPPKSGKRWFLP